jgi:hypothetical protein
VHARSYVLPEHGNHLNTELSRTSHTDRLTLCALLPSLLMVWKMSLTASGTSPGLSAVPCSTQSKT